MARQKPCINFEVCGNMKPQIAKRKGMCNACASEYERTHVNYTHVNYTHKSKNVQKGLQKKQEQIEQWHTYVLRKIDNEFEKHGVFACKECGRVLCNAVFARDMRDSLPKLFGYNVAHIISKAKDRNMYWVLENSIPLCRQHHNQLDQGNWKAMKIAPFIEEKRQWLKTKKAELLILTHNLYL